MLKQKVDFLLELAVWNTVGARLVYIFPQERPRISPHTSFYSLCGVYLGTLAHILGSIVVLVLNSSTSS